MSLRVTKLLQDKKRCDLTNSNRTMLTESQVGYHPPRKHFGHKHLLNFTSKRAGSKKHTHSNCLMANYNVMCNITLPFDTQLDKAQTMLASYPNKNKGFEAMACYHIVCKTMQLNAAQHPPLPLELIAVSLTQLELASSLASIIRREISVGNV